MGFRFHKSIRILPGVRLNLSKSGVSTSIGTRGASINISKNGTRASVGIPGTGISYSEKLSPGRRLMSPGTGANRGSSTARALGWAFVVACFLVVLARVNFGG